MTVSRTPTRWFIYIMIAICFGLAVAMLVTGNYLAALLAYIGCLIWCLMPTVD